MAFARSRPFAFVPLLLLSSPLIAALPLATTSRKLVDLPPAKGMLLMSTWQTRASNQNILTTVPDGRKLKVVRTAEGEEAARRQLCKEQFRSFLDTQMSDDIKVFATTGDGASTLALVETLAEQWSILSLCVTPEARSMAGIVEAEAATLDALRASCADAGVAQLRMLATVEPSLAGNAQRLGLAETACADDAWLCVRLEPIAAAASEDDGTAHSTSAPAADLMSLHDALRTRRTINAFQAELPGGWEAALERAVEAATWAPNHKRTEPWRFHVLGPRAARRVCELNAELVAASKGEAAGAKKLDRWLAMPGWLVVTCVGEGDGASMDDPMGVGREDYAACCCAVQNLCLSLHADGLGTKWTSGGVNFDPRFRESAEIPDGEFVVGTIWFGAPAGALAPSPPKKLAVKEVMTRHE